MKWNGYFKSIDNRVYFVELEKNDGKDTTKSLKFSDDPVEITYESEENIYKPIKASTATISIVIAKYDKNLYSISGRDVSVVIYDSTDDVIVWKGYLTPNVYSQDYDEQQTELQLECQDELSALKYISANELSGSTISLSQIIETTLGTSFSGENIIKHYTNTTVYDTLRYYFNNKGDKTLYVDGNPVTDDYVDAHTDLLDDVYLNTSLFHTKEDEEDYTYFDVLEQLFTFLNFTIYQEQGKYHITQYDNNDFKVRNLNDQNMDCQLNKTSSYKSFKYTHKPSLKTQEFDLFEGIEGNQEKIVEFHSTNPYTDSVKCPNLLLNEVVNPFCYRYGRDTNGIGINTLPTPGGLLQFSSLSIPTSITFRYKNPYKQFIHRPPLFDSTGKNLSFYSYPDGQKFGSSQNNLLGNYGYWDMLKYMGADFVNIGVETNNDEQLGLLIHQPIQDYNSSTGLPETDVLFFWRNDLTSGTIYDNKWDSTMSRVNINSSLDNASMWNACAPLLSFDTNIDVDEFTQYLSFEVEGKAIMNPEMFIGNRSDYRDAVGYPSGKVNQMDEETGSEEHGGWNNHYAFKIRLPIELEIGDDFRLSRNEINTGSQWWNGGLFDGMSFPKVVNKKNNPFKTSDVYMLELMCDTTESDLRDSSSIVATLKGKIKPYDIQGQTFKTTYSAVSNGLSIGISGGYYGLKDIEDCNVLAFNNYVNAKGKLKCTIFSLPPANLYDEAGVALSGKTALNNLYRYVGYWLQGFFITKFKIKEHQSNEVYYEKIYGKDSDNDIEYNTLLDENSFEEFDDIDCMIGNHSSFVSAISKPSFTKYYLDEFDPDSKDDTKILLTKQAPVPTDVFTPEDNIYNQKEIDLWIDNKQVKMEDYTTRNIKKQYSGSNIILDVKTHMDGQFDCMSYMYMYPRQFDEFFVTNSVTYNLKSNIAELNLQEKKR